MNAMTLLQEEQEKPQSKAGPTRHAKIMRGIVTPIFGLLAIACIVLGVLNATIWKPSAQVTASASVTGSQYVVTDPNVLQLVDDRVTISAKSRQKTRERVHRHRFRPRYRRMDRGIQIHARHRTVRLVHPVHAEDHGSGHRR